MIEIIHNQYWYSRTFLGARTNKELYDKIVRYELIATYNKDNFRKQQQDLSFI